MDQDRIHIEVDEGCTDVSKKQIHRLASYKDYCNFLCIKESPCYQLHVCFGTGTCITGIEPNMCRIIDSLKTDRSISAFEEVQDQLTTGTLGCFVKCGHQLYGLTAQHIFQTSSAQENRSIFAEIGEEDSKFRLYDVIYVGSEISGVFEKVNQKVVDAAVFPLMQVSLDQRQLTKLPTLTIEQLFQRHPPQPLYLVEKIGAVTGKRSGVIIDHAVNMRFHNNLSGNFFCVASLFNDGYSVFSEEGDSGSLVTTKINGKEYAIGIVHGGGVEHKGYKNVTFCVEIKPCLQVLSDRYIRSRPMLYKGFFRLFVDVHDRTNPLVIQS